MDRETELAVQVAGAMAQDYLRFLLREPRRREWSGEQHGAMDQKALDLAATAFGYSVRQVREALREALRADE